MQSQGAQNIHQYFNLRSFIWRLAGVWHNSLFYHIHISKCFIRLLIVHHYKITLPWLLLSSCVQEQSSALWQLSHYASQKSKATVGETLQLRTIFFKKSQNSVMLRCLLSGSFWLLTCKMRQLFGKLVTFLEEGGGLFTPYWPPRPPRSCSRGSPARKFSKRGGQPKF